MSSPKRAGCWRGGVRTSSEPERQCQPRPLPSFPNSFLASPTLILPPFSPFMAMRKPCPSLPILLATGTAQSSKITARVGCEFHPTWQKSGSGWLPNDSPSRDAFPVDRSLQRMDASTLALKPIRTSNREKKFRCEGLSTLRKMLISGKQSFVYFLTWSFLTL